MTTKNSKLQLPISAALLEAINLAAAKDMRTQRAFITKILQEHPSVRDCIPKALCEPNVKTVAPQCAYGAPSVVPQVVGIAPQVVTIASQGVSGAPLRGYREYLASGGKQDDCSTKTGKLIVAATGEELDNSR